MGQRAPSLTWVSRALSATERGWRRDRSAAMTAAAKTAATPKSETGGRGLMDADPSEDVEDVFFDVMGTPSTSSFWWDISPGTSS